jgi:hypothetical protein
MSGYPTNQELGIYRGRFLGLSRRFVRNYGIFFTGGGFHLPLIASALGE